MIQSSPGMATLVASAGRGGVVVVDGLQTPVAKIRLHFFLGSLERVSLPVLGAQIQAAIGTGGTSLGSKNP